MRVRNGKLSVTDGPFAETKEQLAGFYLIEARDLNDAIQVAAKDPAGARRQHRGSARARAESMNLLTDLRFALRSLARTKGLTHHRRR